MLDKKVVFYQVQSNAAEIGRCAPAGCMSAASRRVDSVAVNLAGAIPFAVKGNQGVPG
jgi:hypothetical protein